MRERHFNLRVDSYLCSKFLLLTLIGLVQVTLLFTIVWAWCKPEVAYSPAWFTLAVLDFAGTAIGLMISALAQSEEVATAMVPIVIIPQMILAGVITRLSGIAEVAANGLITVYWGQHALERLLPGRFLDILRRDEVPWTYALAIALSHAAVGATITIGALWQARDRGRSR